MSYDRKTDERRYRLHAEQQAKYPAGHCVVCKAPLGQEHGDDCPNASIGVPRRSCVVCGNPATLIDATDSSGHLVSFCKQHEIYAGGPPA